jgi:hypothetical protein
MPKTDHRVELTKTKIDGLPAAEPGQRYQRMDALVPGFGVRVTENGTKSFIYRTRYPGETNASRRELGRVGVMTLADARDKAKKWQALVAKGIDPARQEEQDRAAELRKQNLTFAAVVEDFIRDKLPNERRGGDVEREIRRELLPKWGPKPIADITDVDVSVLIKAKGRTAKTAARNLFALIKRFFRWTMGQPEYGLAVSPCANLNVTALLGEVRGSRERTLSDDELFALWRASGHMGYPVGSVYRLLLLAPLRLREASKASRNEFDPVVNQRLRDRRKDEAVDWRGIPAGQLVWTIPAARMKGKNAGKKQARPHAVPLTPEILTVLESVRLAKGPCVFSTTGGRVPVWMGAKVKQELDRRMLITLRALARIRRNDLPETITPFVNHDIRRTIRSNLSRLKVTEEAREAVLAHARPGIKGTYDLYDYFDEKREALELWAARLRSIVDGVGRALAHNRRAVPNNVVTLANAIR